MDIINYFQNFTQGVSLPKSTVNYKNSWLSTYFLKNSLSLSSFNKLQIILKILLLIMITFFPCLVCAVAPAKKIGHITGLVLPRFASLKFQETNMRSGPGSQYPIKFIYQHQHYPVEIIAEFENWRLVQDLDADQGWVHQSLLSGARYLIVTNNKFLEKKLRYQILPKQAILLRLPEENSYPLLRIELGNIAKIKKCSQHWCKIEINKQSGWIKKINVWGVYQNEVLG